jgi:signal transduction histidine kinase
MWQMLANWLAILVLFVQDHAIGVRLVTGLMSLVFAVVILILRSKTVSVDDWRDWRIEIGWLRFWRANENDRLKSSDWAKWFGWGFAFFAFTYLFRSTLGYMQLQWGDSQSLKWINNIVDIVCSGLVNICFLAAARSLRERRELLPKWAWYLFAFGLVGLVPENLCPFCRLPDAIFSCISLGWIGYATATNITTRRKRGKLLAPLALLVAVLYIIAQGVYALSPLLIWYNSQTVIELIGLFLPTQTKVSPQKNLDSLIILSLIPLKFGLFISALLVQLREVIILSSVGIRNLLNKITAGRKEIFANDGFLEYAGGVVDAELVELGLLMPGANEPSVLIYRWRLGHGSSKEEKPVPLAQLADSEIGRVIQQGAEITWRDGDEFTNGTLTTRHENPAGIALAAVPIKFHGAVIGCFRAECPGRRALSAVAMTHLRVMADLASLAAAPLREVAAADDFSSRYSAWRIDVATMKVDEAVKKITDFLQDILSPVALIVYSNTGFHRYQEIGGISHHATLLKGRCDNTYDELVAYSNNGVLETSEIELEGGPLGIIGKLALVVPAGGDELFSPTLGTTDLIKRTMGALVADAILDVHRDHFAHVLEDLVNHLNHKQLGDPQQWFDKLEEAAKEAGLLWLAVTDFNDHKFFGEQKWVDIVREYKLPTPEATAESNKLEVLPFSSPTEQTHHIIFIRLSHTKTRIWLGVDRQGFGIELSTASPWRLFLDRFSDIADSTLVRMTAMQDLLNQQMQTADAQAVATSMVTAETLFHQLMNMVRDIANPVAVLNDALRMGELTTDEENAKLIEMTGRSADQLLEFASEFMKVTKLGTDRPCALLAAAQQSSRFFLQALERAGIKLEVKVEPEFIVDVPFHVAALAIANLVSNAKDAHKNRKEGRVSIEAWDAGEMIHCRVTDNGPGVAPSLQGRLFEIGATTKPGSGGWGLYLVRRSLRENRGDIDLEQTGDEGTTFLIRFPKPR